MPLRPVSLGVCSPAAIAAATAVVIALVHASPSAAQDALPTLVLLRTHAGASELEGTARGFDRVLRQRLDALGVVRIEGSVELDLEDVQLALGCMGESEACLRAVAEQAGATELLFASLDRAGAELVVSVLRFDAASGALRRAVRTVRDEAAVLETAAPVARELWDLPPVPDADVVADDGRGAAPTLITPGLSPWPFVLLGVGAAALAGGGVALGLGLSDRDTYVGLRPTTPGEVDQAEATLGQAQNELLAGTVLLAAGGALAAVGIGWALGAGREDGSSPLATVTPLLSPAGAGALVTIELSGGPL